MAQHGTTARSLTGGILLAGLALGGCNCEESFVGLQGSLEIDPPTVDFGKIPVGGQGEQVLTLRNKGDFLLTIEGYAADRPFVGPTESATIGTGRSIEVTVQFRPTEVGMASGALRLTTDDPEAPMVDVPMIGEGIEAAVRVEPLVVDFGEVLWRNDTVVARRDVTITNPGTDDFELTSVELTSDDNGAFGLDPRDVVTTFGPGDSKTIEVTYFPVAMGPAAGSVRIATTAPTAPEIVVSLVGTAVGPVMEVCAGTTAGGEQCTSAGALPEVNFGAVELGTMSSGAIRILNTGDRDLTVQGQLLGTPGDIVFSPTFASLGEFVLAPQAEQRVDTTYAPQDYMFDAVNVAVGSNAAQLPSQVVPVRGEVPRPKIEVIPRSLNFRAQGGVGMTQAPVRIINCGTLPLTISGAINVQQTSGPAAGAFSLMNPPAPGTMIMPSAVCDQTAQGPQFMVVFAPGVDGQFTAEIAISTDDPSEPVVTVEVLGTKT